MELSTAEERARLRASLRRPLPEVPPAYLYDDRGSALFEEITRLDAYYPTRTEIAILEAHAPEIVALSTPHAIAELGSGAGRKIRLLLDAWTESDEGGPVTMLDIHPGSVEDACGRLRADYPMLSFHGIIGDFLHDLGRLGSGGDRLIAFFAGTVGNLHPIERTAFFRRLSSLMPPSDSLLLGIDLVKDRARLEAAYDDPEGVTAEFDRNVLSVLNRRFDGTFEPDGFEHRAFYDDVNEWIEMRLRARRAMRVRLDALDLTLDFDEGDELRTEVSCKFTRESLGRALEGTGLSIAHWFTDEERLFALALVRRCDG